MGQGEVQNWIRSRPDQEALGAFSFFGNEKGQQSVALIGWLGFAIPCHTIW